MSSLSGVAGGVAEDVTLKSGSGGITVTGAIGTGIGTLTLQENNAGATGAVNLQGSVTAASLATFGRAYAVSLTGGASITNAVTFLNTGALTLGAATADSTTFTGGVTATAPSGISASGTIATADQNITLGAVTIGVGQTLTLDTANTGGGNIQLSSLSGVAGGVAEDVTLKSGSGGITVTGAIGTEIGTLTLQENNAGATGAANLQGSVTAASLTTFGQAYAVSLTGGASITNAVTFLNTGTVTLGDATADSTTFTGGVTATAPSGVSASGTIATADQNITLGAVTIGVGQTLTLDTANTGGGNIQLSSLSGVAGGVAEDATLKSGSGGITVTGAIGTGIGALILQENNAGATGAVNLQGSVTAASLTTFGQAYAVSLTGDASITNAVTFLNTGTLTLGDNGDTLTFVGGLNTTAGPSGTTVGGTVRTNGQQMDLGAVTLAANSALATNNTAPGGAMLNVASVTGANKTLDLNAGTNGAITATGSVSVSTLTAGAGDNITLTNAANDFGTVSISSGKNVSLRDANAITLGGSTLSGTLSVTAGDTIAQSGALNVQGGASTFTIDTGTIKDVLLGTQANQFAGQTVTITAANGGSVRDVNLRNTSSSAVSPTLPSGLRDLTLQYDNAALALPAATLTRNLNVTAGGVITQSGAVVVPGTATLAAGVTNDITLDSSSNNFGTVTVASGRDVTVVDTNGIDLGTGTVSGNLSVTAAGAITQSGALTVNGSGKTATFAAGSSNNVTLNNAANDFGTVSISSGKNVSLRDANAVVLDGATVSGTLGVTAGDTITQSGALNVQAGASTFTIDTGTIKDVLLGTQANQFAGQTVTITAANGGSVRDVSLRNTSSSAVSPTLPSGLRDLTLQYDNAALVLPAATLTGSLSVTAGGAITQSGPVVVPGTTTLSAAGHGITLDNSSNNLGTVAASAGKNVTLADLNAIALGTSNVSGQLSITAGDAITNSGPAPSLAAASAASRASASGTIERNFRHSKVWPLRPTRVCRKITGPPSSILMASATTAITGADAMSSIAEPTRSKVRLIQRAAAIDCGRSTSSSGSPATGRISSRWAEISLRVGTTIIWMSLDSSCQAVRRKSAGVGNEPSAKITPCTPKSSTMFTVSSTRPSTGRPPGVVFCRSLVSAPTTR